MLNKIWKVAIVHETDVANITACWWDVHWVTTVLFEFKHSVFTNGWGVEWWVDILPGWELRENADSSEHWMDWWQLDHQRLHQLI